MKKICVICDKEFNTKNPNILYCSSDCKTVDLTRICKYCGNDFLVEKRSRKTIYCSKKCAISHNNTLGKMGKNAPKNKDKYTHEVICNNCGVSFNVSDHKYNNNKEFYCTKECYNNNILNKSEKNICKHCTKEFIVTTNNKIFCNENCMKEYYIENHSKVLECKYCGTKFNRRLGNILDNQKYTFCSKECERFFRLNASSSIEANGSTYIAFRDKLSKMSEYLKWREEVLKKYNDRCAICGSTNEIEVHHIIPLYFIVNRITKGIYNNDTLKEVIKDDIFNNINNGICFCKKCHNICHGK